MQQYPKADDFKGHKQPCPAKQSEMDPLPQTSLSNYSAAGKLIGKKAIAKQTVDEFGFYPSGMVQALLLTDLIKQNASTILQNRLEKEETKVPLFFSPDAFETLRAICMRLIPQPNDSFEKIDLAGMFDEQMASSNGNGWRYNDMPPDDKAFLLGLYGIDETSKLMFGGAFVTLQEAEQEELLMEIQTGSPKGKTWEQMPPNLFFEELLCALVELYYSHPIAKDEIGEVAFADAKGWQQIGLNVLERRNQDR